ncbi:MAG: metallophosphoesterase [Kiritimatiellae bacterium]|nr:metallophosphoesterase [Kiritimatiellia bacterium]
MALNRLLGLVAGMASVGAVLAGDGPAAAAESADCVAVDLLANAEARFAVAAGEAEPTWGERVAFTATGPHRVFVRVSFRVPDPSPFVALEIDGFPGGCYELNAAEIPAEREAIVYTTVRGVSPALLRPGPNVLTGSWRLDVSALTNAAGVVRFVPTFVSVPMGGSQPNRSVRSAITGYPYNPAVGGLGYRGIGESPALRGLLPGALAFQTGPVLGCASHDAFTVFCRVNMPAEVALEVGGRTYRSGPGREHRFRAERLAPDTPYAYRLTAALPGGPRVRAGPYTVRTFPERGPLTFVAMGDSRSVARHWQRIAALVLAHQPRFVVFTGDMVFDGRVDPLWDATFLAPASELMATTPFYVVAGNHERGSPLTTQFFIQPSAEEPHLNQEIGLVHLAAPHSNRRLSTETHAQVLDAILAPSRAPYIFVATHWPARNSGKYGNVGSSNRLLPTLRKHGVTAMLSGHEHQYERSEPPGGPTVIVTGAAGAGGGRDDRREAENPDSRVLVGKRHFCVFTVTPDRCVMKAIDQDGMVIDTREWAPRRIDGTAR